MSQPLSPLLREPAKPHQISFFGDNLRTYNGTISLQVRFDVTRVQSIAKFSLILDSNKKIENVNVIWHGVEGVSLDQLIESIKKNSKQQAEVDGVEAMFNYRLEEEPQAVSSFRVHIYIHQSHFGGSSPPFFEAVDHSAALSGFLTQKKVDDEVARDCMAAITKKFTADHSPAELAEIISLYSSIEDKNKRREVLKVLGSGFNSNDAVEAIHLQNGYIQILGIENTLHVTDLVSRCNDPNGPTEEDYDSFILAPHELVALSTKISQILENDINQRIDKKFSLRPLKALLVTLQSMFFLGVRGLNRKAVFEPLVKVIAQYQKSKDPDVAFTAHFAMQSVLALGDDENAVHKGVRKALHFLKGLGHLASIYQTQNILPAWDAAAEFKKAFSLTPKEASWFPPLVSLIDNVTRVSEGASLEQLAAALASQDLSKFKDIENFQHFYFTKGVLALCKGSIQKFPEHAISALKVLNSIFHYNRAKPPNDQLSVKDAALRPLVAQEILSIIYHTMFHNKGSVRQFAESLHEKLQVEAKQDGLKFVDSTGVEDFLEHPGAQGDLFNNVVGTGDTFIWQHNLRGWRDRFFATFTELDREFYYPLEAKNVRQSGPKDLFEIFRNFLKEKDQKALVITGEAGSGKTHSTRKFVAGAWNGEKDCDTNGYVPLFVSLGKIKDQLSKIAPHFFVKEGIENNTVVRNRRYVIFADGYDEAIAALPHKPGDQFPNIYTLNEFGSWPLLKLVITTRPGRTSETSELTDSMQHFKPSPTEDATFEMITPVNTDNFLTEWLSKMGGVGRPTPWSKGQYDAAIQKIRDHIAKFDSRAKGPTWRSTILTNPFYLNVLLRILPETNSKDLKDLTTSRLTRQLICENIQRESRRLHLEPLVLLHVSIAVAKQMGNKTTIADPEKDQKIIKTLKSSLGEMKTRERNKLKIDDDNIKKALEGQLIYKAGEGVIEFSHPILFRDHLSALSTDVSSYEKTVEILCGPPKDGADGHGSSSMHNKSSSS